eukprot:8044211-Pyramimonas_sp.AAC.1
MEECGGLRGPCTARWTPSGRTLGFCCGRSESQAIALDETCRRAQFEPRQVTRRASLSKLLLEA